MLHHPALYEPSACLHSGASRVAMASRESAAHSTARRTAEDRESAAASHGGAHCVAPVCGLW